VKIRTLDNFRPVKYLQNELPRQLKIDFCKTGEETNLVLTLFTPVQISPAAGPCAVSFVKFVFQRNYQNRKNQFNQVSHGPNNYKERDLAAGVYLSEAPSPLLHTV
jgi:hypothetical protein